MRIKEEPFYFSVAVFGPNGPSFVVSSGLGVQCGTSGREVSGKFAIVLALQFVARTCGSSPSYLHCSVAAALSRGSSPSLRSRCALFWPWWGCW